MLVATAFRYLPRTDVKKRAPLGSAEFLRTRRYSMHRKRRFLHLIALVALIVSLLAPIFASSTFAQDDASVDATTLDESSQLDTRQPEPVAPVDTDGDGVADDIDTCPDVAAVTDADGDGCEDTMSEPVAVTPVLPAIDSDVCADLTVAMPTILLAETEGLTYGLVGPDTETGVYTVTATLGDGYIWENDGVVDGWNIEGTVATSALTTVLPCDEPAPAVAVALAGVPDITIEKTGPATVEPGGTLTYTITVRNSGGIAFGSVYVRDTFPAGTSGWILTTEDDLGCRYTLIDPGVDCAYSDLVPEGEFTFTLEGTVSNTPDPELCASGFENEASVNAPYSFGTITKSSDTVKTTLIHCGPEITIEKSGPTSVEPGEMLAYSITITNTGSEPFASLDVWDTLPIGVSDWLVREDSGLFCTYVDIHMLRCQSGREPLEVSGTHTIIVEGTVPSTPDTELCASGFQNQASIEASYNGDLITPRGVITELSNIVLTDLTCEPTIEIVKTGPADAVAPGDDIEFTIAVTNTGVSPATFIDITDDLPEGLTGLEWTWAFTPDFTDSTCERVVDDINCNIQFIPAFGGEFVITLTAATTTTAPVCETYTNLVGPSDVSRATSVSADVTITCVPGLTVEKTSSLTNDPDGDGTITAGDTLTYFVKINNSGNQALTGLELADIFSGSGGLMWIAPAGFDGLHVPDIAVGASVELTATYVVTAADVDKGLIENCATTSLASDPAVSVEDCVSNPLDEGGNPTPTPTVTVTPGITPTVTATPGTTQTVPADADPTPTSGVTGLPITGTSASTSYTSSLLLSLLVGGTLIAGAFGLRLRFRNG